MQSNGLVALVVQALLALAYVCSPAAAGDWTPLNREQALEQTRGTQLDKRRLAYGRLAEI